MAWFLTTTVLWLLWSLACWRLLGDRDSMPTVWIGGCVLLLGLTATVGLLVDSPNETTLRFIGLLWTGLGGFGFLLWLFWWRAIWAAWLFTLANGVFWFGLLGGSLGGPDPVTVGLLGLVFALVVFSLTVQTRRYLRAVRRYPHRARELATRASALAAMPYKAFRDQPELAADGDPGGDGAHGSGE